MFERTEQEKNEVVDAIVHSLEIVFFGYRDFEGHCNHGVRSINRLISMWEQSILQPISWKQFYEQEFYSKITFPAGLESELRIIFETDLIDEPRHFYGMLQKIVHVLNSSLCHTLVNQKLLRPHDLLDFIWSFADAFQSLYQTFKQRAEERKKVWLQEVGDFTKFEIAETMDKFTLFVTMGQEQSTGILSAFLITEMHTNLPDSEFVGWCFLPEPEQIIGTEESEHNEFDSYLRCSNSCRAELLKYAFFWKEIYRQTLCFDPIYRATSVEKMLSSEVCNAVFLKSSVKPAAVFCRITNNLEAEGYCRLAREVGKERKKPVVFLDERGEQPKIIVERSTELC